MKIPLHNIKKSLGTYYKISIIKSACIPSLDNSTKHSRNIVTKQERGFCFKSEINDDLINVDVTTKINKKKNIICTKGGRDFIVCFLQTVFVY